MCYTWERRKSENHILFTLIYVVCVCDNLCFIKVNSKNKIVCAISIKTDFLFCHCELSIEMAHLMKDHAIHRSYSSPLFICETTDDRMSNVNFGSVTPTRNANHLGKVSICRIFVSPCPIIIAFRSVESQNQIKKIEEEHCGSHNKT